MNEDSPVLGSQNTSTSDDRSTELENKANEYLAGWQRTKADFVNYKKEESERMESMLRYASEAVMRDLVSVLDSFDLALAAMKTDDKADKGVYMIRAQLMDAMKRYGLERIDVSLKDLFDPAIMEAVGEMEADGPEDSVADIIEQGYKLQNKVLRPARVRIVKAKN